ncbi:mucin-17-like [Pseudophryne corroboree]|uniref:mucin-17-like n=1 Tax=Pseudophryne corroboree TaxID=495146 RepID=UPI0030820CA9
MCVSECSSDSEKPRNCNRGQCSVTLQGPHCYCEATDQYWYTGDQCQMAISKSGVYGGVATVLAVLLIIIVILAVIACRRQKQSDKHKLIDNDQRWYDDGWEVEGLKYGSLNSAYSTYGSAGSSFQPNLERVNTDVKMTVPRPNIMPQYVPWESTS